MAFVIIGEVLIHCTGDPSGIWSYRTIPKTLNDRNAGSMCNGFKMDYTTLVVLILSTQLEIRKENLQSSIARRERKLRMQVFND